jgi:ankyrin repeat protein
MSTACFGGGLAKGGKAESGGVSCRSDSGVEPAAARLSHHADAELDAFAAQLEASSEVDYSVRGVRDGPELAWSFLEGDRRKGAPGRLDDDAASVSSLPPPSMVGTSASPSVVSYTSLGGGSLGPSTATPARDVESASPALLPSWDALPSLWLASRPTNAAIGPPGGAGGAAGGSGGEQSRVHMVAEALWSALDYGDRELRATTASGSAGPLAFLASSSALDVAANAGKGDHVGALLADGHNPDEGSAIACGLFAAFSPLGSAASAGLTRTIEDLLAAGASPGSGSSLGPWGAIAHARPLWHATLHGHVHAVEALLRGGAPPNAGLSIGPFGLVANYTPLEVAASAGDGDMVRTLLAAGANPNCDSSQGPAFGWWQAKYRPLWHSVHHRHEASTDALLASGASPNAGLGVGPFGLMAYFTPLELAAMQGDTGTVRKLLAAGANPNAGSTVGPFGLLATMSPLRAAAAAGHADVCAALLEAGAHPGTGGALGPLGSMSATSPLWEAAVGGNTDAVRALVNGGAPLSDGLTLGPAGMFGAYNAVDYALAAGHMEAAELLLSAGARPSDNSRGAPLLSYLVGADLLGSSLIRMHSTAMAQLSRRAAAAAATGVPPGTPRASGPPSQVSSALDE